MKIIIHDNNNLNDIFTFQDNISDFSFLLLSENKLYFLECDIIHPLVPYNFCLSLINIEKPIQTDYEEVYC